jgi:WD40 repeat protein
LLVSASDDGTVLLWNMRHDAAKVLITLNPYMNGFNSAVFSPDGIYIAAGNDDGMVRIWDARVGHLVKRVGSHTLVYDVAFMPDGKGLLSGGRDSCLWYWDLSSLYPPGPRIRARSQAVDRSHRLVSRVEEFSGHEVRLLLSADLLFFISPRIQSTPSPSRLTADGSLLPQVITVSVSGTPPTRQCNASSIPTTCRQLILVPQATI